MTDEDARTIAAVRARLLTELERAEVEHRAADLPIRSIAASACVDLAKRALGQLDRDLVNHLQREAAALEERTASKERNAAWAMATYKLRMLRRILGSEE